MWVVNMSGFILTEQQEFELHNNCVDKTVMVDGFVFEKSFLKWPCMLIHKIPEARLNGIYTCSKRTLEEHIRFINENNVENIRVCADSIDFIERCQGLECIDVVVPAYKDKFDFSPLYRMENVRAVGCFIECQAVENVNLDCSKIRGLKQVCAGGKGATGFQVITNLEGLHLVNYEGEYISDYFCSPKMKYLDLYDCKIRNLKGIQIAKELKWIDFLELPLLDDILALEEVAESVEALRIEECPRIKDFSVLEKFINLRHLELRGTNKIQNLRFLNYMKHLKTFVFDMNIVDGDLLPCMQIPLVDCVKKRKHYNMKNSELPKEDKYMNWRWRFGEFPDRMV